MDQIPGGSSAWPWTGHQRRITNAASPTPGHQRPVTKRFASRTRRKYSHEVLAPARLACDSPGVRVCGSIARHPARRVGHEAGVGRVFAALREVPAQAGLEVSSGVVLLVGAARIKSAEHDHQRHRYTVRNSMEDAPMMLNSDFPEGTCASSHSTIYASQRSIVMQSKVRNTLVSIHSLRLTDDGLL
jgi:hypothetical protein